MKMSIECVLADIALFTMTGSKGQMLPQAQYWPWDEDKGLYLLEGCPSLHYLVLKPINTCS